MTTRSEPVPALLDREAERVALDGLLEDLRSGRGRALVVRGEAGVGKSALLEYAVEAAGMRVARAAGVESEMELAFAGLHLLCAPLLDRLEGLPGPQRDALGVAFGLREGTAPDRFMVGLAVLNLLAEMAEDRPLLCVIDDAQWLDRAAAQVLAFAARRLPASAAASTCCPGRSRSPPTRTATPRSSGRGASLCRADALALDTDGIHPDEVLWFALYPGLKADVANRRALGLSIHMMRRAPD